MAKRCRKEKLGLKKEDRMTVHCRIGEYLNNCSIKQSAPKKKEGREPIDCFPFSGLNEIIEKKVSLLQFIGKK